MGWSTAAHCPRLPFCHCCRSQTLELGCHRAGRSGAGCQGQLAQGGLPGTEGYGLSRDRNQARVPVCGGLAPPAGTSGECGHLLSPVPSLEDCRTLLRGPCLFPWSGHRAWAACTGVREAALGRSPGLRTLPGMQAPLLQAGEEAAQSPLGLASSRSQRSLSRPGLLSPLAASASWCLLPGPRGPPLRLEDEVLCLIPMAAWVGGAGVGAGLWPWVKTDLPRGRAHLASALTSPLCAMWRLAPGGRLIPWMSKTGPDRELGGPLDTGGGFSPSACCARLLPSPLPRLPLQSTLRVLCTSPHLHPTRCHAVYRGVGMVG